MSSREYAIQFNAQRVDRGKGVIFGVAVMTEGTYTDRQYKLESGKGIPLVCDHTTLEQIMASAKTYATGLKVKADHRSGIFSTAGLLKNFRIEGKTLRADLHVLSTEENREKLFEMAESIPDTFGLSVSFSGPYEVIGEKAYDRCTEIYSADLVSEPAANPTGLFSRVDDTRKDTTMNIEDVSKECSELAGKLKSLQDAISGLQPKVDADKAMEALKGEVKELSSKLAASETAVKELSTKTASAATDQTKLITETAAAVAKEFAKVIGEAPKQKASQEEEKLKEPKPVEKFTAAAQKHFATTKSKVKAMELAIKDEPEGYKQFRTSGVDIKFAA